MVPELVNCPYANNGIPINIATYEKDCAMNFNVNYKSIKDFVVYSFEEYVEEDGFTASQSAAKILEEDWRQLNYNSFAKAAYYICEPLSVLG